MVLLLDVGPSMHGVLPEVEKVCSMLAQKKARICSSFSYKFLSKLV